MKKLRGKRRYFRHLEKVDYFASPAGDWVALLNDPQHWFAGEHIHPDWWGYGKRWKGRKAHLDALFRHFDYLVEGLQGMERPFQVFAELFDDNFYSDGDSLNVATPNPGVEDYPCKFRGLTEEDGLSNLNLRAYLEQLKLRGYRVFYFQGGCIVVHEKIGAPIVSGDGDIVPKESREGV